MKSALIVLAGFLSLCAMGYGVLEIFAGGMSDAPVEGREMSNSGLILAGLGLVGLIGSIVAVFV